MITFWDTSALINAFLSPEVLTRFEEGSHLSRPHVIAEFFSTMTGRGIRMLDAEGQTIWAVLTAEDAVEWIKSVVPKLDWVDLTGPEVVQALTKASSLGIQGGRVYDYLHAEAAKKGKADKFLTRNINDFQGLIGAATLEWP